MEIDLVKMVQDVGLPGAVVLYVLYRDWRFSSRMMELLTEVLVLMRQHVTEGTG